MTAVELDPVFVKALKLLHSKAKDSGAQLKALLDDAIAQRKGIKVATHPVDGGKSSPSRSKSDDDSKKKGSKDNYEPEVKKPKLDSKSRSKDERDARDKEKEKERAKREKEKREKDERDAQKLKEKVEKERKEKELASSKAEADAAMVISDEEELASHMDAGDFALEMGIACVMCRQFDVSSGNQLVECQECHSLYHQECHKPPVTEEDVSDPRFVWYCSRCTRSLKRMMTQKSVKPKPTTPSVNTSKESTTVLIKPVRADAGSKSVSQAFRRIDPKSIVPSADVTTISGTASKPMVGLAGLAANLHKSKGESKSGGTSRKGEQKGEGIKSSLKLEIKSSNGGNKSDSSSKPNSAGTKLDVSSKPSSAGHKDNSSNSNSAGTKLDVSSKPSSAGHKDNSSNSNSAGTKLDVSSKPSSVGHKDNSSNPSSTGTKLDVTSKPNSAGNRLDGSSKSTSSSKSEDKNRDVSQSVSKEKEKKFDLGKSENKLAGKIDDKKSVDLISRSVFSLSSSSSSSSSVKDEKKSEKKHEPGRSPSNSESSPQASTPTSPVTPTTPDSPSPSKINSSTSKKQAVANLSLVTANKRIQMMKKKAQTKPGTDKKLHIK